MSNQDHRSKVTIEDLLRLKRAERPPVDFWNRFEAELRQKQLAALVDRRPWWHDLSRILTRRAYLPVGAVAVFAFTLVSVKYYGSRATAPVFEPVTSHAAHLQTAHVAAAVAVPTPAIKEEQPPVAERTVALLSDRLPDSAAELTPWSAPRAEETPSAKSIAASMARLESSEPEIANAAFHGSFSGANGRIQDDVSPATSEFAEVSSSTSKRSRLLAQLEERRFTPEPQAPELVRERLARRLADTDFNDSFSRVGLERGGVSLKF